MPTAPTPKTVHDQRLALIEKSSALAYKPLDDEAIDRARRIVNGTTTPDAAYAELDAKYAAG
ncbi:hypothetical protein ACWGJ9_09435 [Curtobacterium citreum]